MIFKHIPLNEILVDESENYRTSIDEKSIKELHKSFVTVHEKTGGTRWMLNPVDVVELEQPVQGKKYKLLIGFRRFKAAKYTLEKKPKAWGWAGTIPAMVREDGFVKDNDQTLLALIENIHREEVNPLDEALACRKVLDSTKMTMTNLAAQLGKTKSWVSQRISLLQLSPEIQASLASEKINFSTARGLARLPDMQSQEQMLDIVEQNEWGVEELNKSVASVLKGKPIVEVTHIFEGLKERGLVEDKPEETAPVREEGGTTENLRAKVRKVSELLNVAQEVEQRFAKADSLRRNRTLEQENRIEYDRQSAFLAGAQTGIAYALGQIEEINFDDYTLGEE